MEKSLVLIKPDAVQRGLIGEIIVRLEKRGLTLVAAKYISVSRELAERHYAVHLGKPFYEGLLRYICSSPVMAMVWQGEDSIAAVRQTMGVTNPLIADPGTIRHDFALGIARNLTHASDSVATAENEISLWFTKDEIIQWQRDIDPWIFGKN